MGWFVRRGCIAGARECVRSVDAVPLGARDTGGTGSDIQVHIECAAQAVNVVSTRIPGKMIAWKIRVGATAGGDRMAVLRKVVGGELGCFLAPPFSNPSRRQAGTSTLVYRQTSAQVGQRKRGTPITAVDRAKQ